jgi:chemosensory pili system protein ChpA (sensor histidine kinase/response regulator)
MNRWLEEERTATADLFSLIDFAHRYFSVAIESLKTGGTTPEEQAVVEAAGQLRRGEPLGALVMPIVACGSPASTAAAAEAPEPASAPTVAVKTADREQSDETESSPVPTGAAPADADAPAALDFAPLDPLSVVPLGEGPAPDEEMPSLDFSMPMRVEELQAPAHDLADDVAPSARSTWSDSTAADACEPEVDDRPSLDFSIPMPSPLVAPPSAVPHAADEAGAPHESAAPVEAAPPADDVVHIGEVELSPTLFGVFVSEAQTHLAALAEEAVALARGERVSERLQRAAHTLAGIAGTVRIEPMRELGHALELATARLAGHGTGGDAAALVGECIAELDRMAAAARDLRMPDAVPELVQRLDEIGLAAPAQEEAAVFVEEVSLPAELAEATAALPAEPDVDPALAAVVDAPPLNRDAEGMAAGDAPAAPEAAPATDAARAPADRRHRRIDDDLDPELLPIFLEEAADLVPAVGQALRDWRAHSDNAAIGHALQRSLHTLKGSARMCGAMSLGELTHAMESRVENALALSVMPMSLLDELEASYDRMALLHERLLHPREAEALPPWPAFEVRAPEGSEAEVAAEASAAPAPAETASTPAPQSGPPVAPLMATRPTPARSGAPEGTASPLETGEAAARAMLRVRADVIDRLVNEAGEIAIARSRIDGEMRALKGALGDLTENVTRLRSQLREVEIQAESQMASRLTVAQERDAAFDPLEFDRFTRFQELTRMMAESVNDVQTVHHNIIKALDESDAALSAQARLNRELQQNLMRIRMVPFQSVAERLYRVVRQAAKELDKRAVLDIRGAQVELDRSVLERITAPFEHLLRNCVAHGIETPAGRAAAGKKELGEIRIELRQEGNEVMMAVSDDGAGIDVERVRAKAIALGLTEADAQLADKDIAELIFHSGFSTAAEVSQIAGRGVGMDVVKSEVQALGGRVEIAFERGKGTRFTIYLPLTLAVTQAVLVRAGGAIYAIPSALVEQVRQLKEAELQPLRETGLAVWQDRQYPFRQLPRLLGDSGYVPEKRRLTPVLYVRSGANVVALQLDEVVANQEIVVKNAGPLLSRIAGITGATVLGSGRIVLILNPVILADREPVAPPPLDTAAAAAPEPAAPTVMIVDDSLTVRKITGRLLAREGYNVVTAKDGVDAIEQLQDAVPDLMLVDIEMPRMDGFDLTRNVRNDRRLKHVPIVMITSRTAEKHRTLAREIGVDVFLGKPYQEEELLEHVATLVKRPVAA